MVDSAGTDGPPLWRTWREAWTDSQYGSGGFYARGSTRTSAHFRTSSQVGGAFTEAVCRLIGTVDEALGCPDPLEVIDVGAGEGHLLSSILAASARFTWGVRLQLSGVDVRARPASLSPQIVWIEGSAPAAVPAICGLLIAAELLDDVPCNIAEPNHDGDWRIVCIDSNNREYLGGPPTPIEAAWLARWAPNALASTRIDVGSSRDDFAAALISRVEGSALIIDYPTAPPNQPENLRSTFTGFRYGYQVPPIADGSMNLTSHVNFDSLTAALSAPGRHLIRTQQSVECASMTIFDRSRTALSSPLTMPELVRRADDAYLSDPHGVGAHTWLTVMTAGLSA